VLRHGRAVCSCIAMDFRCSPSSPMLKKSTGSLSPCAICCEVGFASTARHHLTAEAAGNHDAGAKLPYAGAAVLLLNFYEGQKQYALSSLEEWLEEVHRQIIV